MIDFFTTEDAEEHRVFNFSSVSLCALCGEIYDK